MFTRFDLTDLRLFLMVVEHGSLTHGARAMNLALASASERISGMESALGAPLLERTRRGVRTTAAGDVLARHARQILSDVEQMHGELHPYGTGLKARVRLLSNTAALAWLLPHYVCRFLTKHSELSLDIDERPSKEIVSAIAEKRADLGIVADITDLTALRTQLIARDQLVVVVKKAHRVGKWQSVTFADIVEDDFVGLSDAALEAHLGEHAARLGVRINYRIHVRSIQELGMLIEAGVGMGILPKACTDELQCPSLSVIGLSEPWAFRRLYICARDFETLPSHTKLFAQHLVETIASRDRHNQIGAATTDQ